MNKNGRDEGGISIKELAAKIFADPFQWVLFLGDGISCDKQSNRKKRLFCLAREVCKTEGKDSWIKKKIYEAIQKEDYLELSGTLFGNMWDGAIFLDETGEEQMKWRRKYAGELPEKKKINISNAYVDLEGILQIFQGMIITTCQDETIEAFLEYEMSRSVDDMVYTPYVLAISEQWKKWMDEGFRGNRRILVKLYGSRRDPYRMLLSKKDMKECYAEKGNPKRFLKNLLETKNLLFLGMDFGKEGPLSYGKEIQELLKKHPGNVERYVFGENETEGYSLADYYVKRIDMRDGEKEIKDFARKLAEEMKKLEAADANGRRAPDDAGNAEKTGTSTKQEGEFGDQDSISTWEVAKEQFGHYYNRRSCEVFLEEGEESEILKTKILGFGEDGKTAGKWSRKSVKQLAVAANNVADFYDLEEIFHQAEVICMKEEVEDEGCGKNSNQFYEVVTKKILDDRLSRRSRILHQILLAYGDGFPLGFLWLLSDDEEELKEWKRAGIQLTGSGIYMKRQRRKNLHERMLYADNIMRTAGTNPYKKEFKNRVKEMSHQLGDSYFYLLNSELVYGETDRVKKDYFEKMFERMHDILRDKSVGYKQLHSLLQTEMPEIIKNMEKLEGEGKIEWEPALLYYLLNESRSIPKDCEGLKKRIKNLSEGVGNIMRNGAEIRQIKALANRLMLFQTESLIECQSSKEENQKKAISICKDAETMIYEWNKEWMRKKTKEPEEIFKQRIHINLLKGKIYARHSSILEINRCMKKEPKCEKQEKMLNTMRDELKKAKEMMDKRRSISGNSYDEEMAEWNHLMGEYWFKMSQSYWEDRQYGGVEKRNKEEGSCYINAEEFYKKALAYYGKYPDKFEVQRADVMRSMADLHCQNGKSIKEMKDGKNTDLKKKCYHMLIEAYDLYRSNGDLHGIADVLQSMGNVEDFYDIGENNRSPLCFYKASGDLYWDLNDSWSLFVVERFYEEARGRLGE